MSETRCDECGHERDPQWGVVFHAFTCSRYAMPGQSFRKYYPEREQRKHEGMGKRVYHARYLEDRDPCPAHPTENPWWTCTACEVFADYAMDAGVDF